jgi:hypothetical protein
VAALTTTQVAALDVAQMPGLATQQIAALGTAQVAALGSADLNAFDATQFGALTTRQLASLTTEQFAALATAEIAALTTGQMHALSTADLAALTTDQVLALPTADLAALTMTQAVAFTSDQFSAMTGAQISALLAASPIVLDLDGNGVSTTSAAHGVRFDLTATGHAGRVGWVAPADGLLAIDLDHDGRIADGSELFGVGTRLADGTHAANGYVAMAQYDDNHDGRLDAADAHFKDLRVWVDANHDGRTDAGELKTLDELHVASLDLHGLAGTQLQHGNLLGLTSSYTTSDGAQHAMADVWFAKDAAAPALGDVLAAPAAEVLPGHAADEGTASAHAHAAHAVHGLVDLRRSEDELAQHGPLV